MSFFAAIPAALQTFYGAYQMINAKYEIDDLEEEQKRLRNKDPLQLKYEAYSLEKQGYSPEEKAAFYNDVARSNNQAYRTGYDKNPTLGGALMGAIRAQNLPALLKFNAADAGQREKKRRDLINLLTRQDDARVRDKRAEINQKLQLYGQAGAAGISNSFTGLQTLTGIADNNSKNGSTVSTNDDSTVASASDGTSNDLSYYDYSLNNAS